VSDTIHIAQTCLNTVCLFIA